jgi:ribosomal protein S18 acetylase RimI-like enzyme
MLVYSQQVNDEQQKQLDQLSHWCEEVDKGLPAIYQHLLKQKRITENNVFYYKDEVLVGFLSVYFFFEDACEVTLMVAPDHRRQGVATELLQGIFPLLESKNMKNLIFSTTGSAHEAWFKQMDFTYKHSEYHMERDSFVPIILNNPSLTLKKATPRDINMLCAIDIMSFSGQQSMPDRFFGLLADNEYTLFLAYKGDQVVGKAHIRWQPHSALLSDIAILPPFQRKGLGGELLSHCINYALNEGKVKITLDVEANNSKALNLYSKNGFKTTKIFDFWSVPMAHLQSLINKK